MESFKGKLNAGIRIDGNLLSNLPRISYFNRKHTIVSIFTIKQTDYSVKNTTIVYDIGILKWHHVSVFQNTIFRPTYIRQRYNQCVPECTFYLRKLAWMWSKERPKHVDIVRYQYHILFFSWLHRASVLTNILLSN